MMHRVVRTETRRGTSACSLIWRFAHLPLLLRSWLRSFSTRLRTIAAIRPGRAFPTVASAPPVLLQRHANDEGIRNPFSDLDGLCHEADDQAGAQFTSRNSRRQLLLGCPRRWS